MPLLHYIGICTLDVYIDENINENSYLIYLIAILILFTVFNGYK